MPRPGKWIFTILLLAGVAGLAALAGWWGYGYGRGKSTTTIVSLGPSITQLERLSELATLKVHVADVLKAEDRSVWGDIRGAWLIKGDALLSVDMKQAKITDVDPEAHTLKVTLPGPRVIQARIDHEHTVVYDWQKGWLRSQDVAADIWKEAMKHAQRIIEQTAASAENDQLCRQQTEAAIQQMYSFIGWKATIVWADR